MSRICPLLMLVLWGASWEAMADEPQGAQLGQTIETEAPPASPASMDDVVVTRHETTIGGETVAYTVTAGTLPLTKEDGKVRAHVFFVAYARDGVEDLSRRPVTFCFNGGPGSSSVWLHLGLLAPRRVELPESPEFAAPPYRVIDNEHSLLDRTDLVFIDPVSTGYSRPAPGEDKQQFHGYEEDLESVGEFVHLYTTHYGRWSSPRFLMGESYGGLRAAGLAGHMMDRYYMTFNGIVLISAVLDFQTILDGQGSDLPYILYLPTYTATAWHHGELPADLQERDVEELLSEVEAFAIQEYAPALMQGAALPEPKRAAIAEKVARYTGLSADYVRRSNLRLAMSRFAKELLREEGRTVGRFDSRYVGVDRDAAGSVVQYDPSASALFPAFTGALYGYLRDELRVTRDVPYEILTDRVHPWNFDDFRNRYVDVTDTLHNAMTEAPYMKVFVATGEHDLATPYFAMQYSIDHLALDESLRGNIVTHRYPAGHMMYVYEPTLRRMKDDLARFYESAVPALDAAD